MKRILLTVAYDGTGYSGFQAQKSGVPTIEKELNEAITELTGVPTQVSGASRTDAGVHALCNLAVFDTPSRIPAEKFANALNVRLPAQICVQHSREVPDDFHPRFCETVKTYEYVIYNARLLQCPHTGADNGENDHGHRSDGAPLSAGAGCAVGDSEDTVGHGDGGGRCGGRESKYRLL